jgi:hypothetical protein
LRTLNIDIQKGFNDMEIIVFLLLWCGLCGGLSYAVTPNPDKKSLGAILGAVLGPLGILIAVFLK